MRTPAQVLLALLLVSIAGYAGYLAIFGGETELAIVLVDLSGDVVRTSADGAAETATAGMPVRPADRVTVGADGNAVLAFGPESTVRLEAKSSVRVLDVDATGVRIELEGGRVQARVRAGSPILGINSRGRGVVTDDGDFTMGVDGEGALSVRAERGRVELQGIDGVGSLPAGQRLDAMPGRDPVTRTDVAGDAALLLEVVWPEAQRTRDDELAVQGRTEPYARVEVGQEGRWAQVRAGPDGRFSTTVPLVEGDNAVVVRAEDALGNEKEDTHGLRRDSTAPPATSAEVLWGP